MRNIFSLDNWFFRGLTKIVQMLALNALFVVGCVPVFTIGPSFSALYYTINKNLMADRGYVFGCYWQGFKENFKRGALSTLIFLAVIGIFFGDAAVMMAFAESGMIPDGFQVFFYVLIGFVVLVAIWTWASMAMFDDTLKNSLMNALKMMIAELPVTALTAVILVAAVLACWLLPVCLLIIPICAVWLMSLLMQKRFRKYMTEEQKKKADFLYDPRVREEKPEEDKTADSTGNNDL